MLRVEKVVLSLLLITSFTSIIHSQNETCEHNITSPSGNVNSPGTKFVQEYCKWTIVPPNAYSTFLVKVLSATLPTNVNLIVYSDDGEDVINKDCENCLDSIVTSSLKIFLQRTDNATFHFSPKFNISYEVFLPQQCARPLPLKNGQIIGDNFKVGNTILFNCLAPYHMVGNPMAHCIKTKSSPVPEWSVEVPVCTVPNCLRPIKLTATTRWSAISNPGYENGHIETMQKCFWDITATRKDQRLRARFHSISLFGKGFRNEPLKILIYDGNRDNLVFTINATDRNVSEITTKSNRMIVVFRTGVKVPSGATGFVMNYSSVSIQCPNLMPPMNGKIFPKRKSHGLNDVVKLICNDGYSVVNGSEKLSCTVSGEWSGRLGECVGNKMEGPAVIVENVVGNKMEVPAVIVENVTEVYNSENASVVYNNTQIRDYDPFSIKNESSTKGVYKASTVIVTYVTKPTKFKKKKAHYNTKAAVTKPSKKPTMLYSFTRSTPKTKVSSLF